MINFRESLNLQNIVGIYIKENRKCKKNSQFIIIPHTYTSQLSSLRIISVPLTLLINF